MLAALPDLDAGDAKLSQAHTGQGAWPAVLDEDKTLAVWQTRGTPTP